MKKLWLKYDGVIAEVILNTDAGGGSDAEIHVILVDGTPAVFRLNHPTEEAIVILRDSIKKEIHVKVEAPKETP